MWVGLCRGWIKQSPALYCCEMCAPACGTIYPFLIFHRTLRLLSEACPGAIAYTENIMKSIKNIKNVFAFKYTLNKNGIIIGMTGCIWSFQSFSFSFFNNKTKRSCSHVESRRIEKLNNESRFTDFYWPEGGEICAVATLEGESCRPPAGLCAPGWVMSPRPLTFGATLQKFQ